MTLHELAEILYFFLVKYQRLSPGTRMILSVFYVSILITFIILTTILFNAIINKEKLRKKCNLLARSLLLYILLLLLTIVPLTLLEMGINELAAYWDVVAIKNYLTLLNVWCYILCFIFVLHIGLNSVPKIKRNKVFELT